jgi:hypothetical protein
MSLRDGLKPVRLILIYPNQQPLSDREIASQAASARVW